MKLKALYDPSTMGPGKTPRRIGIEIHHTGDAPEQNFDDRLVEDGIAEGWAVLDGGTLTLEGANDTLVYDVKRGPGYYCRSNGAAIPITPSAWARFRHGNDSSLSRPQALAWLEANGKAADDYEISVSYQCVLRDEHHRKWRAVRDRAGNLVPAHTAKD